MSIFIMCFFAFLLILAIGDPDWLGALVGIAIWAVVIGGLAGAFQIGGIILLMGGL